VLFEIDLMLLFSLLLGVLFSSGEAGRLLGKRVSTRLNEPAKAQIAVVQGALLGLLALLMGFTFAMAMSRFDARKDLVVDEANAIGTAYLRAQILPEPERSEAQQLFRAYVNDRVQSSTTLLNDPTQEVMLAEADRLFEGIWRLAMSTVERDIHADAISSFVESLNEMNDLRAKRIAALENHVPESALYLLIIVATLSIAFVGYGFGISHFRGRVTLITVCLVTTLVVTVILDMDRPRRGIIRVSQKSLLELQHQINGVKPAASPR